uniref:Uncharacterized protein n=1 Tax=Molossus molossus TaxID=27622 RepID=A0A7J8ERC4_MOLMO|nr:hypothetical protein HJG59_008716 [Molossus molossus]
MVLEKSQDRCWGISCGVCLFLMCFSFSSDSRVVACDSGEIHCKAPLRLLNIQVSLWTRPHVLVQTRPLNYMWTALLFSNTETTAQRGDFLPPRVHILLIAQWDSLQPDFMVKQEFLALTGVSKLRHVSKHVYP